MKTFLALTKRNIKLFFKDKGMFFVSLITPVVLLVLYATFLASVYRDSVTSALPDGLNVPDKLINGIVGGELFSSLLAVSCVTVAFCSNLLMVNDKVSGARKDMSITPVRKSTVAVSYFVASLCSTLIVSFVACAACFIYIAATGWYFSFGDVMLIILDVILLTAFGTAISSVINCFLSSQGQASAVGTIVSAGYGFICGAYMPISSFASGLQKTLMFLPGTYGTALIRSHSLNGAMTELASTPGVPAEAVDGLKSGFDCTLDFFGHTVSIGAMYGVLIGATAILIGAYILINVLRKNRA